MFLLCFYESAVNAACSSRVVSSLTDQPQDLIQAQRFHTHKRLNHFGDSLSATMTSPATPFAVGCFVWLPWRRIWYLARVEETRDAKSGGLGDIELLIHVHGEPLTKDKWMTVPRDGAPLHLLQVLPTALTRVGSLPAVGNRVQLLVMDQKLVQLVASRRTGEDPSAVEVPTLVGIVVKVMPARDASLVDVTYPAELPSPTPGEAQWQRVQIGNGYITVISESRFAMLQHQLAFAIGAPSLGLLEH